MRSEVVPVTGGYFWFVRAVAVATVYGAVASGRSTLMSSLTQPGSTPVLLVTQALSPMEPLDPTMTLPPGPVETWPRMSALPTATELTMPWLVATSPLSRDLVESYLPLVLRLGSVESKLSVEMLLPLRSIWPLASMAYWTGVWRLAMTRTLRLAVGLSGV